jgi:hypothetical protein
MKSGGHESFCRFCRLSEGCQDKTATLTSLLRRLWSALGRYKKTLPVSWSKNCPLPANLYSKLSNVLCEKLNIQIPVNLFVTHVPRQASRNAKTLRLYHLHLTDVTAGSGLPQTIIAAYKPKHGFWLTSHFSYWWQGTEIWVRETNMHVNNSYRRVNTEPP